jgi:hypothetical protein
MMLEYIVPNDSSRMNDEFGKDLERSSRDLIEVLPQNTSEGLRKTTETAFWLVDIAM